MSFFPLYTDDEPIHVILHVSSAREKQDYRQQSASLTAQY
jgi:hypothetical protein